ncbi:MAG: adenylyl-sulfate reductase, partial [Gammaproteobacteria bacterium]|nr:adenylyl-sulfate reductase [Gammaproteobacteria bacterium]
GVRWYQLRRADIFIVSLLLTATFALIWSYLQSSGAGAVADMGWTSLFFALFIVSNTVLFSTVMWSKFAHMFFKPAAALQKRVAHADGGNLNLPQDFDLTDPAVQAKFPDIPQYMGKNPANMGAGIRREPSNHY